MTIAEVSLILCDSTFEVKFAFFAAQLLNLALLVVWPVLAFKGIRSVLNNGGGAEVPLWILLVLLFPIIGAWMALSYFGKRKSKALSS